MAVEHHYNHKFTSSIVFKLKIYETFCSLHFVYNPNLFFDSLSRSLMYSLAIQSFYKWYQSRLHDIDD